MPKHFDEHGMRSTRSKKSDKSHRNFELHGTYSSKHLRLREEQAVNRIRVPANHDVPAKTKK